ncbi:hypothetical protein VTK56DRAFT_2734 [Thermocarpiscus australiensis]
MTIPVAAKVGIIAASVAVAAAIALYESPEVRRVAGDLRRRIAIALHSLGDNIDPSSGEPRFNRPEDAEGFYQSHDVDADDETRRRQREELMYWNARREEQKQRERESQQRASPRPRGTSFDDFLQPDEAGERGSFVYNSSAQAWDASSSNLLRRRGNAEGVRGLNASMMSNPFSDEHGIELDERPRILEYEHEDLRAPGRDEVMSDIYNATPRAQSPSLSRSHTFSAPSLPVVDEVLFDFQSHSQSNPASEYASATEGDQHSKQDGTSTSRSRSATLEREPAEDEHMTAGQDDRADAYASIQAWAQNSSGGAGAAGFYSPLPVSPQAPLSEPEVISAGQLTPTDSASVAGSAVEVAHDDAVSSRADEYDVMSETDGGGIPTPGSWSEVASVVSESESAVRA